MKFKTSYFNKGLIFANLKRFWWVAALHALVLFLTIPMQIMMMNPDRYADKSNIVQRFYHQNGVFSNLMICVVPIFLAVIIFRYLHTTKSTTTLHGLPFTRNMLFGNSVLSGVILFSFPIVVNAIIVLVIKCTMPIGNYIGIGDIGTWVFNSLVLSLVLFSLAAFVGMFTGNSAAHFVFTYIIHFLPFAIYALVGATLETLVFGFSFQEPPKWMLKFPMFVIAENFLSITWIYIIASVILLGLALYVYKKRPLENASDIVVFNFFKPIFKYGVTFCATTSGYLYITALTNGEANILSAFIWALIGYIIAEMLLQKTFRIWKSYKGFVVYAVILLIAWGGIKFDVTGYEKRLPNLQAVEEVEIRYPMRYTHSNVSLSSETNINAIYAIHKTIIENMSDIENNHNYDVWYSNIDIKYKMKNGRYLSRSYSVNENLILDNVAIMYETEEFKIAAFPILTQNIDEIKYLEINDEKENKVVGDKQEIKALTDALKKDILNSKYTDVNKEQSRYNYKNIYVRTYKDDEFARYNEMQIYNRDYFIYPSYENVNAWLREH